MKAITPFRQDFLNRSPWTPAEPRGTTYAHGDDLQVHVLPFPETGESNYGFLLRHESTTLAVDVPQGCGDRYLAVAEELGWGPITDVLITHWHWDHNGDTSVVLNKSKAPKVMLVGGKVEFDKLVQSVPGDRWDRLVVDGEVLEIKPNLVFQCLHTPGHTKGHICYYLASHGLVFAGDTFFSMGCGRLFEGDAKDMWGSLSKFLTMPDDTAVYSAHEYTETNAKFTKSQTVIPCTEAVEQRVKEVLEMRERKLPTVPTVMEIEKQTSPFIRVQEGGRDPVETLRAVRGLRDNFRA
eukprot:TRINITY_DN37263_c0_g1_i1.p1 TRINITY_DN37263_c0_g1~~TRINITY_DN37263_c0_g1_i1.p1  ORF type:complete len:295 (-),score=66.11 TRINITY_DN37263_c0_g1_i1:257-1141(-)